MLPDCPRGLIYRSRVFVLLGNVSEVESVGGGDGGSVGEEVYESWMVEISPQAKVYSLNITSHEYQRVQFLASEVRCPACVCACARVPCAWVIVCMRACVCVCA